MIAVTVLAFKIRSWIWEGKKELSKNDGDGDIFINFLFEWIIFPGCNETTICLHQQLSLEIIFDYFPPSLTTTPEIASLGLLLKD